MRSLGLVLPLLGTALAYGQGPTFQRYGRQDGLPHDQVRSLHQDERGYLWIGTAGRLCRHDGSTFRPWPPEAGAPERVDHVAAAAGGRKIVGSSGPTFHLYDPDAQPCFRALEVRGEDGWAPADLGRNVAGLAVDGSGRVFVATEAGLFSVAINGAACSLRALVRDELNMWYGALATDDRGRLLYARPGLAVRLHGDEQVTVPLPDLHHNAWTILPLGAGRCRVLGDGQLCEVDFDARTCRTLPLPTEGRVCTQACIDRRGTTWLGTVRGLWRLADGEPAVLALPDVWIRSLCVDRCGDVWIGTQQNGLLRCSARPFTQLRGKGAQGDIQPVRMLRTQGGALVASYRDGLYRVQGDALLPTRCAAVPELRTGSLVEADAWGNLWFATGEAVLQVAGIDADAALHRWPVAGLRPHRDARGRVLFTTADSVVTMVPDGPTFRMEQLPLPPEWRGGRAVGGSGDAVWLLNAADELWRLSAAAAEPCTDRGARLRAHHVHQDRKGRLWLLPTNRIGLAIAEPGSSAALDPRWVGTAEGLPGDRVVSVTTDEDGSAWLTLAAGLCHFDVASGKVSTWPWPADIALSGVNGMAVDPQGRVLVATHDHVIAFAPNAHLAQPAARVLVTSLLVAGAPWTLPDGGASGPLEVATPAGRGDLLVQVCAPGSSVGSAPVQYRLLPSSPEYGAALQGPLQIAGLAPGDYRLELRAAALDGMPPGEPTSISLRVPRPFWMRAEFAIAVVALAIALGIALHRLRVRRLLALEAVRRQVATDLHDDLGSGLAQVAVLSEVVKREAPPVAGALEEIAGLARAMRESLSDIVWAVDPTKDTLAAVINRLRQVAANLFADGATTVRFVAPDAAVMDGIGLRPDRRRHLFLFCKEALTNAARHARAAAITIQVEPATSGLRVAVTDDGCGFDTGAGTGGNGLRSLRARATALGATFTLRSAPGRGTGIELAVPAS